MNKLTHEQVLRKQLVDVNLELVESGLNQGSTGNLSVRLNQGFLITPSALPPDETHDDDIVFVDYQGTTKDLRKPSSEWRFHRDIYHHREEINAVIHTHSPWCTTLACLNRDVPAFHYMIAIAGGDSIRCAPYARFGSQQLSDHVVSALVDRKACLLSNHGMIAVGETLAQTYSLSIEIETLAQIYAQSLQIAEPVILSKEEMQQVIELFKNYKNILSG